MQLRFCAIALLLSAAGCDTKGINATMQVEGDCALLKSGDPVLIRNGEGHFTAAFAGEVRKDMGKVDVLIPGLAEPVTMDCIRLRRPMNP